MICHACQKDIELTDKKASFREECPHCDADAHVCLNCEFYDAGSYNECKETSADRVVDKEKNNRCEYFRPGGKEAGEGLREAELAKKKLEEMFK